MKLNEIKKIPKGTYAAVDFDKSTTDAVIEYIKEHKIPNGLRAGKMHTTLLYSRKYLPDYVPAGKIKKPYVGRFSGFEIFKSSSDDDDKSTNCLVLRFICESLSKRHKDLMKEHGATYDYDEYKPHITLSYDVGELDPDQLPSFVQDIIITKEYGEELND